MRLSHLGFISVFLISILPALAHSQTIVPSDSGAVRDCARFRTLREQAIQRNIATCERRTPNVRCQVVRKTRADISPLVATQTVATVLENGGSAPQGAAVYEAFGPQTRNWYARCPGLLEALVKDFWDTEDGSLYMRAATPRPSRGTTRSAQ